MPPPPSHSHSQHHHPSHHGPPPPGPPGGPGGPPPTLTVGPIPPTLSRVGELLDYVRADFETLGQEVAGLRFGREEMEGLISFHAQELSAMRQISFDLDRKHHELKQAYESELHALRGQVTALQSQLHAQGGPAPDSHRPSTSGPSSTAPGLPGGGRAGPAPGMHSSASGGFKPPQLGGPKPPLPMYTGPSQPGQGAPTPPASLHHPLAPPAGLGHPPPILGSSGGPREDPRSSPLVSRRNELGGAQGSPKPGPPPAKRERDEPMDTAAETKENNGSSSKKEEIMVVDTTIENGSTNGTGSGPAAASAPSPAKEGVSLLSSGGSGTTPAPAPEQPAPGGARELATAGMTEEQKRKWDKELKKEGSDWMTMFNPNVRRVLDVGLVHTFLHDSVVCCVKFSPDGKLLATGCNRNTTLYDTKTGAKVAVLVDESTGLSNDNYVRSLSFSPDGKWLATGSEDRIIRVWSLGAPKRTITKVFQGHKSEIYSLSFTPDGRRLVSGSGDRTARMWDVESGACLYTLQIEEPSPSAREDGHPVDAGVTSVVVSPDGRLLAAGSLDTNVRIWDAETGEILDRLRGHKDSVYSVAFSPDGKYLVSGSLDRSLKTWDLGPVTTLLSTAPRPPFSLEGEARTPLLTNLQGHKDYVLSVDMSPDGAWIVSGSKDRGVQFWDPKTSRAQFMLQGHKNSVISVAVSPKGGMIATGSGDWSARMWSYGPL